MNGPCTCALDQCQVKLVCTRCAVGVYTLADMICCKRLATVMNEQQRMKCTPTHVLVLSISDVVVNTTIVTGQK
jgi:hypothetical protein